jgi:glycosyltransferase involved in cell wall biosynthesis
LVSDLSARGIALEVIGSDEVDCAGFRNSPGVAFLNLRGSLRSGAPLTEKVLRILRYYARLVRYAFSTDAPIFHILWNNKFETVDRTILMVLYKLLGKKVVLTAHNTNTEARDGRDSLWNRITLRIQYRLSDHLFVHTTRMRHDLVSGFGVNPEAVSVIPYGENNALPLTALTPQEARLRLGVGEDERAILFFGAIAPYKGLDTLLEAFRRLASAETKYRLIIAGKPKGGCGEFMRDVRRAIAEFQADRIIQRIEYIPDEETEVYFKAADLVALPYRAIYQSGILFLAFSFGAPVVATDVGSFGEDVRGAQAGFIVPPEKPQELADAIRDYFESDLFRNRELVREAIRRYVKTRHSWELAGKTTVDVYHRLLKRA